MARQVRVRGIRRKQIDEDKLALAFLLLAKTLSDERRGVSDEPPSTEQSDDEETA